MHKWCIYVDIQISLEGERIHVFTKHVFHKLLLSHTDSISDTETNNKWNKKACAFVFDMGIICSLTAIIALDLLEHEHQQLRQ